MGVEAQLSTRNEGWVTTDSRELCWPKSVEFLPKDKHKKQLLTRYTEDSKIGQLSNEHEDGLEPERVKGKIGEAFQFDE